MRISKLVAISAACFYLSACAQQGGYNGGASNTGVSKESIGTLLGAGGGALLGSQVGKGKGQLVGVAIGTLLGAGIGNSIGASMDKVDQQQHQQTFVRAMENNQPGQALPWQNQQSGHSGSVTPSAYYQAPSGEYCREFTQTINVGGQRQQGVGRACRQPDGTWQIVSQ